MRNSGHTIGNARWEAGNVRDVLTYYSAAPERLFGRQIPVAGGVDITFREPLGVVGAIVPWNFPMPIAGWAFAPALAAGNTVVLKPAELTPLTAMRLAELALEAGLPEDVFTVLPGKGSVVGQRLVEHPDVRKIVFTGSTEVGKGVMAGCAARVKRLTLELGGKSANVVFADADLEKAAATAPSAVFDNAGQDCCARSRILVQRSAYDRFLELLEPAVQGVRVEDPSLETARDGPADQPRPVGAGRLLRARTTPRWRSAARRPTAPASGSRRRCSTPTDPRDRALTEEIFGPVVAVVPFDDEADADPDRQRGRVRPVRIDLDPRRGHRAARLARHRGGQPVGQQPLVGALLDTVRRLQAVGARPRAGTRRAALVHGREERLHRDGRVNVAESIGAPAGRPGGGGDRRGERHRAGHRPPVRVRGRARRRRRRRPGQRQGRRRGGRRAVRAGRRHLAGAGRRPCSRPPSTRYGGLDIAFNNAGISPPDDDSILTTGLDAWRRVQEVNLTSVYLCCKAAIPHMQARGRGSIINTASFVARMGAATSQISYTASKGGVLAMSRELGVQFAREGIRVNALSPGPVNTPLLQELFAKDPERAARRLVHIPMGRFAEPDGDRGGRRLPGVGRLVVHHRQSEFLVDGGISGAYVTPL